MFGDLPARRGGSPGTADKTAAPWECTTHEALNRSKQQQQGWPWCLEEYLQDRAKVGDGRVDRVGEKVKTTGHMPNRLEDLVQDMAKVRGAKAKVHETGSKWKGRSRT